MRGPGLHRVRPLAYTGTGLTGAERDLAERRGVGPGDRDGYVTALAAILRRDPVAVGSPRYDLSAVRDRAANALAFERAARVQDQLDAVAWLTSPQRVTSPEPVDFEVAGWSDGILVRFQIRAGRVCTWTQRCSTAGAARRHLAATPAGWAEFADRSALLAARLTG
jgi:excinuclease ABC subunit C